MKRRGTIRRLAGHGQAIIGGSMVLIIVLMAIFGPVLSPYHPNERDVKNRFQAPSGTHWLGTDYLGRDLMSRIVHGAAITLQIGIISVGIGALAGTLIGVTAGFTGGRTDLILSAIIDIMLAFPGFVLALMIVAVLGPSLQNAMVAVGINGIPVFARVIRSETIGIKHRDYVEAARAIGASNLRIIMRYVMPNAVPTLIVQSSLQFPNAVLTAAGLSFIGLGAQPPLPEWGRLLAGSKGYMAMAPWLMYFPGAAIMFSVLGFNLLGNALRDILDPRLRR